MENQTTRPITIFLWIGVILTVAIICILYFGTAGSDNITYPTLKECSEFVHSGERCESRMTSEGMRWRVVSNHLPE